LIERWKCGRRIITNNLHRQECYVSAFLLRKPPGLRELTGLYLSLQLLLSSDDNPLSMVTILLQLFLFSDVFVSKSRLARNLVLFHVLSGEIGNTRPARRIHVRGGDWRKKRMDAPGAFIQKRARCLAGAAHREFARGRKVRMLPQPARRSAGGANVDSDKVMVVSPSGQQRPRFR